MLIRGMLFQARVVNANNYANDVVRHIWIVYPYDSFNYSRSGTRMLNI
jgi:hypothetical protein